MVTRFGSAKSSALLGLLMVTLAASGLAQPKFSVPITVNDGQSSLVIYLGILPTGNFCIVPADSMNGHAEYFLPPVPPAGVFDARFLWPRTGSNPACFDQGSFSDFRPYTSAAQRDTFRLQGQLGNGSTMVISWPANLSTRFTGLTIRFIGQTVGTVNTDMLTNTSVDITDAGDPARATIFSAGLVPVSVEQTPGMPQEFALNQNFPNPFNPSTTIHFSIERSAMTDISVFDILGRKVATLTSGMLSPGFYDAHWDGTNGSGSSVASGMYVVRMNAQTSDGMSFSAIRKLLLLK